MATDNRLTPIQAIWDIRNELYEHEDFPDIIDPNGLLDRIYGIAHSCHEGGPTCGYCRDCKWWTGEPDSEIHHGYCLHWEENEESRMFPEGEGCGIATMPDFGCLQFEAREEE